MASTALLDLYIRRVLGQPNADVFSPSNHMSPPTLMNGRVNYILTFRGCFNPPHEGHKATLCHGFFRGGKDIRLIAAFIFALNDKSVAWKYNHGNKDSNDHVFTRQERINLINNSGLHGGWHWCHPRGADEQEPFEQGLIFEAAQDGFEIQFLVLTGPDHIDHMNDDSIYRAPTIVVGTGDPERTSFRRETETGLRTLVQYKSWRMEPLKARFIQKLGASGGLEWLEQKLLMLFPGEVVNLPQDDDERLQVVKNRLRTNIWRLGQTRFCRHFERPTSQWVRYVPTRFFGMTGGAWFLGYKDAQVSSTRLRHMLANCNDENKLQKALAGTPALSPQLLFMYIQGHKQRAESKRKHREENTRAMRLNQEKAHAIEEQEQEVREGLEQKREQVRRRQTAQERVAMRRQLSKALADL